MTLNDRLKTIKMVIFDVDGVMTDGRIIIDDNGIESKAFHARDGIGIKMLSQKGIICTIITGRKSNIVQKRAEELCIVEIHQGVKDKLAVYEKILEKYGFKHEEVLCIGDDVPEREIFESVGISVCVNDAHPVLKETADHITKNTGGNGAVREVTDMIMNAKGWELYIP